MFQFQLDDQLLADVGLADLPANARQSLLSHVYEELEVRVGTKLSDGLSDGQLAEYEAIVDCDQVRVAAWLQANAPDFLDDPLYARIAAEAGGADKVEIVCIYAATKWLDINRPDYRDLVAAVFSELKIELSAQAHRILAIDR